MMNTTAIKRKRPYEEVTVKAENMEVFDAASPDLEETSMMMSPMFPFTSNILDMISPENKGQSPLPETRKATSEISANMLAAYQSVLNKPLGTKKCKTGKHAAKKDTGSPSKITDPSPDGIQRVLITSPTCRVDSTPMRGSVASTKSASRTFPNPAAKAKLSNRPPRVIGGIADIRNQLLTKFTEVAAGKDSPGKRQSLSRSSNNISMKKRPTISSELMLESKCRQSTSSRLKSTSDNSKTETTLKSKLIPVKKNKSSSKKLKKVPPKVHRLPSKMAKQNIAFADPVRKVAGAVESMLSSAITKVLNAQPRALKTASSPTKLNEVEKPLITNRTRARSCKSKFTSKEAASDTDDESDESHENPPWENENDEDSNNYEGEEGSGVVKIELVTDEQEPEFECKSQKSNLIILPGPATLNVNNENSSNEEDPLADSTPVVKMEEADVVGVESLIDEHNADAQLFGGECSSEYVSDTDQTTVDVKPVLMPTMQMGTDIVNANCNVEMDNPLPTAIKIERAESLENSEDIIC